MKDINIVFVNYRMKNELLQSVPSLLDDLAGSSLQAKIVVVDNSGNIDGLREALTRYPEVRYIDARGNVGFGQGNVIGFKAEPARYYFALNPDTLIPKNSHVIERLVKFMDEHPRVGCIGPKLINPDGTLQHTCYRFDLPSILIKPLKQINFDKKYAWVKKHADKLEMKDFDHRETRPVDWVLGAAMIARREVVEQVGWFDERYFMYLEDCDWCRRMWEAGWPVYYVHDIVIGHAHARESAKVPGIFKALLKNKTARIHLASWLKFLWKWRGNFKYYAILS